MTAAVFVVSSLQVGGGGNAAHHDPLSCLGLLLAVVLLPILSYTILKARSFANRTGKDKAEFTSLRGTGKTIEESTERVFPESVVPMGIEEGPARF